MKRAMIAAFFALVVGVACCVPAQLAYRVPILMYHDIVEDNAPVNSMCVTRTRFQQDINYLRTNGYTALLSDDLNRIRAGKSAMPEKPVVITFDDGYVSNYQFAYPVLRQNKMRAIIAVVAGMMRTEEVDGNQHMLTWSQCKEMSDTGTVEIGCHSYALHNNEYGGMFQKGTSNGVQRLRGESHAQYRKRVGNDLQNGVQLIEQKVGKPCQYFSYPFGATDSWFLEFLATQKVMVTTTTNNKEASLVHGLYGLPRYHVTMDSSVQTLLS